MSAFTMTFVKRNLKIVNIDVNDYINLRRRNLRNTFMKRSPVLYM